MRTSEEQLILKKVNNMVIQLSCGQTGIWIKSSPGNQANTLKQSDTLS